MQETIAQTDRSVVLRITADQLKLDDIIKGYGRVHELVKRAGVVQYSLRRGFCQRSVAPSTQLTVSRRLETSE